MRLRRTAISRVALRVGLAAVLVAAVGCEGIRYVSHLLDGQFAINANLEPIDAVLQSNRLTPQQQAKLELAVAAREYARNVIGLNVGDSYSTFHDTRGKPLIYNLSASRKDRFEPYQWTFPIFGTFPYLGFFDEAYLRETENALIAQGYDTFVYSPDAYSTLGILADPVRSPMLERGEVSLADTIIHELLHNTVWRANDIAFNETMASFVGQQGAAEFLSQRPDGEALADAARAAYADQEKINAFLVSLFDELTVYYASDATTDEKVAGRDAVYEAGRRRFREAIQPTLSNPPAYEYYANLPTNNAWLLGFARYSYDLSLFERVYAATGEDWPATLAAFRSAARSAGDPYTALREWLTANEPVDRE